MTQKTVAQTHLITHSEQKLSTHISHKLPNKEMCTSAEPKARKKWIHRQYTNTDTQINHCLRMWDRCYDATDNLVTTQPSAIPTCVYFPDVHTFMSIIMLSCSRCHGGAKKHQRGEAEREREGERQRRRL